MIIDSIKAFAHLFIQQIGLLTLLQDGERELAEYVLDDHVWNILDYPAELTETDFKIEDKASTYEFDIKGEKLTYKFLGKQLPLDFSDTESGLTDLQLTRWLEPRLRQPNIRPENLLEFIRKTIRQLLGRRNIPLVKLVRARFQLLKAMAAKIKEYQLMDSKSNYRMLLFGENAAMETTYDYAFTCRARSGSRRGRDRCGPGRSRTTTDRSIM